MMSKFPDTAIQCTTIKILKQQLQLTMQIKVLFGKAIYTIEICDYYTTVTTSHQQLITTTS